MLFFFFFQAEDGIRDPLVTGVQTCALPISPSPVPTATAVGVASPSASGHAITTAEIANVSEVIRLSPAAIAQIANVMAPADTAKITRYEAARAARRWPGAFEV